MAQQTPFSSSTGLTKEEAQAYHSLFMSSTIIYVLIALGAHVLAWFWRPWFPPLPTKTSMIETITAALPFIA